MPRKGWLCPKNLIKPPDRLSTDRFFSRKRETRKKTQPQDGLSRFRKQFATFLVMISKLLFLFLFNNTLSYRKVKSIKWLTELVTG